MRARAITFVCVFRARVLRNERAFALKIEVDVSSASATRSF